MNSTLNFWILGIILLLVSCNKDRDLHPYSDRCDYARLGDIYAENDYKDISGYGLFEFDGEDTIDIFGGQLWDDLCQNYEYLRISNLPIKLNDTILLEYSFRGTILGFPQYPTASYTIYDGDSPLRTFDLVQSSIKESWAVIESYDSINNTIKCSFEISVKHHVPDSIPNLGDPNRPDTLHFKNGYVDGIMIPE